MTIKISGTGSAPIVLEVYNHII